MSRGLGDVYKRQVLADLNPTVTVDFVSAFPEASFFVLSLQPKNNNVPATKRMNKFTRFIVFTLKNQSLNHLIFLLIPIYTTNVIRN